MRDADELEDHVCFFHVNKNQDLNEYIQQAYEHNIQITSAQLIKQTNINKHRIITF